MLKGDCKSIILRIKVQGISRTHVSNNMRTSFGEWPESVFCRVSSRLVRPFFGLMCLFFLIGITITHTHIHLHLYIGKAWCLEATSKLHP